MLPGRKVVSIKMHFPKGKSKGTGVGWRKLRWIGPLVNGGWPKNRIWTLVRPSEDCEISRDRKSTRLNSSHVSISYAVFCLKIKNDVTTLVQVPIGGKPVFVVVTDNYLVGIWQGGRAPAIDGAGTSYIATVNGKYDGRKNSG